MTTPLSTTVIINGDEHHCVAQPQGNTQIVRADGDNYFSVPGHHSPAALHAILCAYYIGRREEEKCHAAANALASALAAFIRSRK